MFKVVIINVLLGVSVAMLAASFIIKTEAMSTLTRQTAINTGVIDALVNDLTMLRADVHTLKGEK